MKQYCRYCTSLCTGNGIYCDELKKELSYSYTRGTNTCKHFDFCNIDAYGETDGYKPRPRKKKNVNEDNLFKDGA